MSLSKKSFSSKLERIVISQIAFNNYRWVYMTLLLNVVFLVIV